MLTKSVYTEVNFNEYASQNAGRVFINRQDQLEMLPVQQQQPYISPSTAFIVQGKAIKIIASLLSFILISSLYHLIGEEVPGLLNKNLRGRKLLTFCLVGKLFPKSFIRHCVGLGTNFSINFEYALLSTLTTILITRILIFRRQKFYAKQRT